MIRPFDKRKPNNPRRIAGYLVFAFLVVFSGFAEAKVVDLYFNGNGGKINGYSTYTNSHYVGETYSYSGFTFSYPTKRFVAWYYDQNLKQKADVSGKSVYVFESGVGYINYYAKWETDNYYVNFATAYGTGTMNPQEMIASEAKAISRNQFTRQNYAFLGWDTSDAASAVKYTDGQTADLSKHRVNGKGDITLYAVWAYQYKVRFHPGDYGEGYMDDQIFVQDVKQSLSRCDYEPKTGMRFNGWLNGDGTREFVDEQLIEENLSSAAGGIYHLYAQWMPISYTIRFNANGGRGGPMSDLSVYYSKSQSLPRCEYSLTGYAFSGWAKTPDGPVVYSDGASVKNLATTQGAVVTLYAKWTPISYAIGFEANGGEGTMAPVDCIYDQIYNLPPNAFTRVGARFLGWTTNGAASVVYQDGATVSNMTTVANSTNVLHAVWSVNEYHLSFDGNGGSGVVTNLTCRYGKVYAFPSNDFVRTGYRFDGWTNSASATVFAEGAAFSNLTAEAGVTLPFFAKWNPITYRIAFDGNGATSGSMSPIDCVYDVASTLTSNAFINSGLTFSGWAIDRSGPAVFADGATVSNLTTTADDVVPLFAVWEHHTNDYNVALDNPQLVFWKDSVPAVNRVSVFDDASAVNGSCIRIAGDADGDNQKAGVHLRTGEAGKLIFNWRVVNGGSKSQMVKEWKITLRDEAGAADLWSYHVKDFATNMTSWTQTEVELAAGSHDIYLYFQGHSSSTTREFSARLDNVRFRSSKEEQDWLEKYFPGGGKSLDDPNPLKPGQTLRSDYIAGTDPTNALSRFTTSIAITNGVPYISWNPDLGSKRVYELWGSSNLSDWITPTNSTHRFFQVSVDLP